MQGEQRARGRGAQSFASVITGPENLMDYVAQQLSLVTSFLKESAAILNASASVG